MIQQQTKSLDANNHHHLMQNYKIQKTVNFFLSVKFDKLKLYKEETTQHIVQLINYNRPFLSTDNSEKDEKRLIMI